MHWSTDKPLGSLQSSTCYFGINIIVRMHGSMQSIPFTEGFYQISHHCLSTICRVTCKLCGVKVQMLHYFSSHYLFQLYLLPSPTTLLPATSLSLLSLMGPQSSPFSEMPIKPIQILFILQVVTQWYTKCILRNICTRIIWNC